MAKKKETKKPKATTKKIVTTKPKATKASSKTVSEKPEILSKDIPTKKSSEIAKSSEKLEIPPKETPKIFEEEGIKIELTKKPECIIELDVKIHGELINRAQKNALKETNKTVDIPGFRKGKAPEEMILKQHRATFQKNYNTEITNLAFLEAQNLSKTYPLNKETRVNFRTINISDTDGHLFFSFETEPTIPTIDVKQFKLQEPYAMTIDDEKIDEMVRQSRFFFAKWIEV